MNYWDGLATTVSVVGGDEARRLLGEARAQEVKEPRYYRIGLMPDRLFSKDDVKAMIESGLIIMNDRDEAAELLQLLGEERFREVGD